MCALSSHIQTSNHWSRHLHFHCWLIIMLFQQFSLPLKSPQLKYRFRCFVFLAANNRHIIYSTHWIQTFTPSPRSLTTWKENKCFNGNIQWIVFENVWLASLEWKTKLYTRLTDENREEERERVDLVTCPWNKDWPRRSEHSLLV